MSDNRTLARPYAKAIFELARDEKSLEAYSQHLNFLALIAKDKQLENLYKNPQFSEKELSHIFLSILKKADLVNPKIENFILLLAHQKRLVLLPIIANLYEEDKAEFEKQIQVSVTSAFPLSESIRLKFKKALEINLQCEIEIYFAENPALIGGAVIRMGDKVIDGSVKLQLEKLRNQLCH